MERLEDKHFESSVLRMEHYHRYMLAAYLSRGRVVDCACGIGYGSAFFDNKNIECYQGFDPEAEAVEHARNFYARDNCDFLCSKLESLPLESGSVDTFISLETLEHLEDVSNGLSEIKRVLSLNGVFIGSVPSYDLECEAERLYGKNVYHLHKFHKKELIEMLKRYFETIHMFGMSLEIGSVMSTLNDNDNPVGLVPCETSIKSDIINDKFCGSIFFVCGKEKKVKEIVNNMPSMPCYFRGINKLQYDEEEKIPLLKLCEERWQLLKKTENMVLERDEIINKYRSFKKNPIKAILTLLKGKIIRRTQKNDTL